MYNMLKIKELTFTPDNLKQHLNKSDWYICATWDTLKGNIGDVFKINDIGLYRLDSFMRYPKNSIETLANHHCMAAGFLKSDYISKLNDIYPHATEFYVHYFWRIEYGGNNTRRLIYI